MNRPISNSEVQAFLHCRRRWWLSYYRKLRPKQKVGKGPLALGSRVHLALAAWYSTERRNPYEVYKEQLNADRQLVPEAELQEFEREAELGRRMLEGYFQWVQETGADAGLTIVSDEEELTVPSGVPGYDLVGKLDVRVIRDVDESRLFVDHKTCNDFGALKTLHMDPQMLHYHVLEMIKAKQDGSDARCDGALYNMLRKVKRTAAAKPPFFHREEVRHNILELRNYYWRLAGIIRTIDDAIKRLNKGEMHQLVVYPTPTRDCSWRCEHFALCPLFDDGSHAEGLIEAAYETHDPYERYETHDGE